MKRPTNPAYAMDHIEWDRKASPSGEDVEEEEIKANENEETPNGETYTHPDVAEAADWLANAMNERGFEADFSPESLIAVDRFMTDSVSAQVPGCHDFFSEDLSYRSFALGAYVGETIRRSAGGEWKSDANDPLVEINVALLLANDVECFPMRRVLERLNDGPASSFVRFAEDLGFEFLETPAEETESPPNSPEDFNIRGSVMLWHHPATVPLQAEYHFAADTTACVNLLGYFTFLETKTIPSLKSISALTAEEGVMLPESHNEHGTTRSQIGIFYDPELEPDYWRLVDEDNQLYIEMGHNRLVEFKDAVGRIFLGHDTPQLGTPGQLLRLWPKAKTAGADSEE